MYVKHTPESQGLSSRKLLELLQRYDAEVPDMQGITVLRHGVPVLSAMKKPYDFTTHRMLYSASKSFAGLAVGLLVTDGLVDVNDKFLKYQRDKLPKGYDPRMEDLRIKDILMFNSNCVTVSTSFIGETCDWVTLYLSHTLPRDPGTGFQYDTGGSMALCSLVNAVTGRSAFELVNERLFLPMGITDACWLDSPQGYSAGGWGLYLSMDDLAKVAILLMNKGCWEGKQLISADYLAEATAPQTPTGAMGESMSCSHYGYQFWIGEHTFNAMGAYGTMVNCCPKEDIAVVLLANSQGGAVKASFDLLNEYLFAPSNPETLPEDPEGLAALQEKLDSLALPLPGGEAADAAVEEVLFGRLIPLEDNIRGIRGIHLNRDAADKISLSLIFRNRCVPLQAAFGDWADNHNARAGIRTCFDDEAVIHTRHCVTYGFKDGALYISDQLLQTNNTDAYILRCEDGKLRATVQVSTVLGGQTVPEPLNEK